MFVNNYIIYRFHKQCQKTPKPQMDATKIRNKLQERRATQNEGIKSGKKWLLQQIDEIAKKKSLLLTFIEKDTKRHNEVSATGRGIERFFCFATVKFFERDYKTET